jgi:hypothetical protein
MIEPMVRIRYENKDGLLVTKPMIAFDHIVQATISPSKLTATVFSQTDGNITNTMTSKTLTQLKKNVKLYLIELGVNFDEECRPRLTKGITDAKR